MDLENKPWWSYLEEDLQELLRTAVVLSERVGSWDEKFHDYSFVVFPASKAYEGFLKKLFLDLGFISEKEYFGKRFRVGKALNPSLDKRFRKKESVYDRIVDFCGGKELADKLWTTWRQCRNLLFHWFPNEKRAITYSESKEKVQKVIETIDAAFKECKIDRADAQKRNST